MHIGVFGGTFDPVHFGHLIMAEQCREQAALDQVWFVPSARPPHKLERPLTPFAQRVEMLALALAGQSAFRVEEIEKDRPGPSYTADTLDDLSGRHPDNQWFLLVGSDTLSDLPTWHDPERVVARATLVVVARSNHEVLPAELLRRNLSLPENSNLRLQLVQSPIIDISSSDLRARVASGRSLRYFLPRAVECYIQAKGMYQPGGERK
jgi:nicotinate-nucleotide adenylyltransferase